MSTEAENRLAQIAQARKDNSEAAHYRIQSLLNSTANECQTKPRAAILTQVGGFVEAAELSGMITLEESDLYKAQIKHCFDTQVAA